jgi:fibro-slime domain-containing protein
MTSDTAARFMPNRLVLAAIAGAGAFILADLALAASAAAQTLRVPGVVRDFPRAHPDFDVVPSGGYGHYAGLASYTLPADQRPDFSGGGFRVNAEWVNKNNDAIAPHMYVDALSVPLGSSPALDAGAMSDTWDSSTGPYTAQVPGAAPPYAIGGAMPVLTEPSPFVASIGDTNFRSTQNGLPQNTIKSDLHCNNFVTQRDVLLVVDGNVTILCDNDFTPNQNTHISLTPGSTLKIYFKGLFKVHQGSSINMPPDDPWTCIIYNLGTTQMEINQSSAVCAIIYSPDAALHLAQGDQFFGKFVGTGLDQDQFSGFHWDMAPWRDACTNTIEDKAGAAGAGSAGAITSAATFDQWFTDVLGVNLSQLHWITMKRDGAGVYEADMPEFHPIDDRLLGNEGDAHNYFFTYTIVCDFTYSACSDQFIEFAGADDAWIYINGALVIDLGGVMPGSNQIVELDRLNLADGNVYQLKLYYAQRQTVDASFKVRTNVELQPATLIAAGTGGFD